MKKTKEIIIITSIFLVLVFGFVMIFVLSSKFDDVEILSIRKEYNLVFNKEDEYVGIPLYIEKKNTFLSDYEKVSSISISNDDNKFIAYLEGIEKGIEIEYNNKKYYEYIYYISFKAYDDFNEPVFMPDAKINIAYNNNEFISLSIGNMCLYFNKNEESNNDLIITKLSAVTNIVNGMETIVGLNVTIYNNADSNIEINKIKINNKFYELDYMNYETKSLDAFTNLKERNNNYSYTQISISNGDMKVSIDKSKSFEMFIPIKFTKNIYIVDRLPLYIDYKLSGVDKKMVIDDFQFMSITNALAFNGIDKYVYSYR